MQFFTEIKYLGNYICVRRSSASLSMQFRLSEADNRTRQLKRTIRSRCIIPAGTRLGIWQTCVLSSALHGLHAHKSSQADLHTLTQWYHKQTRAVTHQPAHLTKISNADLRPCQHPQAPGASRAKEDCVTA